MNARYFLHSTFWSVRTGALAQAGDLGSSRQHVWRRDVGTFHKVSTANLTETVCACDSCVAVQHVCPAGIKEHEKILAAPPSPRRRGRHRKFVIHWWGPNFNGHRHSCVQDGIPSTRSCTCWTVNAAVVFAVCLLFQYVETSMMHVQMQQFEISPKSAYAVFSGLCSSFGLDADCVRDWNSVRQTLARRIQTLTRAVKTHLIWLATCTSRRKATGAHRCGTF